jgi:quinol monooxygenase YgiN
MNELLCIARLKINKGKLDEFKRLNAKCAEIVRTKDKGTLQYDLYFNSDETACVVIERYRDSQALLDHHKNLGDTMAAILKTCSGEGEICGKPSAKLVKQLEGSPVQAYWPYSSLKMASSAVSDSDKKSSNKK